MKNGATYPGKTPPASIHTSVGSHWRFSGSFSTPSLFAWGCYQNHDWTVGAPAFQSGFVEVSLISPAAPANTQVPFRGPTDRFLQTADRNWSPAVSPPDCWHSGSESASRFAVTESDRSLLRHRIHDEAILMNVSTITKRRIGCGESARVFFVPRRPGCFRLRHFFQPGGLPRIMIGLSDRDDFISGFVEYPNYRFAATGRTLQTDVYLAGRPMGSFNQPIEIVAGGFAAGLLALGIGAGAAVQGFRNRSQNSSHHERITREFEVKRLPSCFTDLWPIFS